MLKPCMFAAIVGLGLAGWARGADDAQATVDKAIAAHGGAGKAAEYPALTMKLKGKVFVMGMEIAFTAEYFRHLPEKSKSVIDADFMGQKVSILQILKGDKGWMGFNGDPQEAEGDILAEMKAQSYLEWVTRITPLKDKGFTLASLGESKVNDKPAIGVKVSRKDQRDINLYFDKDSGLLVKYQCKVKDPMQNVEFDQESFFSNYKDTPGGQRPTKINVKRDGQPYLEAEYTEVKAVQKLDDKIFDK